MTHTTESMANAEKIAAGRICEVCGVEFTAPAYRVARGHGKTCRREANRRYAQRRRDTEARNG